MLHDIRALRTGATAAAMAAVFLTGCSPDSPMPTDNHMSHGVTLASIEKSSSAQTLNDLRRLTAPLHDLEAAEAAQYTLLVAPPLTALDGCISNPAAGGMGYHYTRGNNLGDDTIELLDPEFLVYAPTRAPRKEGEARRRLSALEYFIPYSTTWPGPDDLAFTAAPTLHDFASFTGLPDVEMAATPFGGWAIHIWLWEHNPDGMFTNFNQSVPQCEGPAI